MKMRFLAGALLAAAVFVPAASADETTFCNTFITSLPYTIATQGHYCLDRNLSTAITSGVAITINVDFVVLDLNNFKVGGGSAGMATDAIGIYAFDHSNITIRGGNIRGFAIGIGIEGPISTSAKNITIENNVVDGSTRVGIAVGGQAVLIRNNTVSNTGGSTSAVGFCVAFGDEVVGISNNGPSCAFPSDSAIVDHNVVFNVTGGTHPVYGIVGNFIDHNFVEGVFGTVAGSRVIVNLPNGMCRDNRSLNTPGLVNGCTDAGGNTVN
jgi:parallel beta-helix repeat protein